MGVKADISDLDSRLIGITDALSRKGMRKIQRVAERELRSGTVSAFRGSKDPNTGRNWLPRREAPGWPALRHTGGLRRALDEDSQLYGADGSRMLLRSVVKDSRSGNRSYHAIAGAQFYGRRDQREKMIGRGSSRGKGGPMPGRPFTGVSPAGRLKIRKRIEELVRRS